MTEPTKSAPVDLGHGFTVEFSFTGRRFDCEWSPSMPTGEVGRSILPAYRTARDEFLSKVAETIGGIVAVVEVGR